MSDESDGENRWVVPVVVLIVVSSLVVAAAVTRYPVGSGTTYQTDSGLSVTMGEATDIESGNPFVDSDTVSLRNISFTDPGGGSVTLEDASSDWVNLSSVNPGTGLTIDPDNKSAYTAGTSFSNLDIGQRNLTEGAENIDVVYSAPSAANLTVEATGFSQGTGVVAVDAGTGTALDSASVGSDGDAVLNELPSGTHEINIRKGPATLQIFNESNPDQLIQTNVNITLRFFRGDNGTVIDQRTTSDGTIDLTGLPTDERVIITADDPSDNLTYRRVVLSSLTEQSQIYMLPTSQPTEQLIFQLNDRTGNYPASETILRVERPLRKDYDNDGDNETRYQTIYGDTFGAAGEFPAILQNETRYRLRITGPDGNERILGAYQVIGSRVVPIEISQIDLGARQLGSAFDWDASYRNHSSDYVTFNYSDPKGETTDLDIRVYERGNESNEILDTTISGPLGNASVSVLLSAAQENKTWMVAWNATRNGEQIGAVVPVSQRRDVGIPLSDIWKSTLATGSLLLIGGLFGRVRAEIGAIVVSLLALSWWYIGWMPKGTSAGVIVFALGIAIIWRLSVARGATA